MKILTCPQKAGVEMSPFIFMLHTQDFWDPSLLILSYTTAPFSSWVPHQLPVQGMCKRKYPFSYENFFVHVSFNFFFFFREGKACCLGHQCFTLGVDHPAAISSVNTTGERISLCLHLCLCPRPHPSLVSLRAWSLRFCIGPCLSQQALA